MVKDLAFVAYSVRDIPRATAFYRDVVGLRPGNVFGDHWAEFDIGTTAFGVGNGEPLGFIPGQSNGAMFEVDDIDAARQGLIAGGAGDVSEINEFPSSCRSCFASDPEGNRFGLHQRL
jgi:predicted enzyme related to lactoylglutathione lyase